MATNANVRLVPKAEVTVLKKSHSPPLEERLLCSASRSSNSVARIFRHSGTGRNGNGIDMDRSGALDVGVLLPQERLDTGTPIEPPHRHALSAAEFKTGCGKGWVQNADAATTKQMTPKL